MLKVIFGLGMTALGSGLIWFGGKFATEGWSDFRNNGIPNDLIEIDVNQSKEMQVYNRGRAIKELNVFVTTYTLDEGTLGKGKMALKSYSRSSGPLKNIPRIKHDQKTIIDLKSIALPIEFGESPASEIQGTIAFLLYYGIRTTYISPDTNKKYYQYEVTSGYTNFPSTVSNPERTAATGDVNSDFANASELRKEIIAHMKKMYNDP